MIFGTEMYLLNDKFVGLEESCGDEMKGAYFKLAPFPFSISPSF
jgi:hypothetical protein